MKAEKLSFKQLAIATALAGSAALSVNPFDVQASTSGGSGTRTHQCVRREYNDTVATDECKDSGERCATVSEC